MEFVNLITKWAARQESGPGHMRIAQASSDCAFAQSDDGFAIIRCPFTEL